MYPEDKGCSSPIDPSELADCADGFDDDGDGLVDAGADPSCANASQSSRERTECSNGLDDDRDLQIDFLGDTLCRFPADDDEASNPKRCGLGSELVLVVAAIALRRRRKARRAARATAPATGG